jgi:hypothetical protein
LAHSGYVAEALSDDPSLPAEAAADALHARGILLAVDGRIDEGLELVRRAETLLAGAVQPEDPRLVSVRATAASMASRGCEL